MRVADGDYLLKLHNGSPVVNYARFLLADGTILDLEPRDFRLKGNNFVDSCQEGNKFSVGSFIGKTVNICLDNSDGNLDAYDFFMSRFVLKESVQVDESTVKHVTIGTFTVVTDYTPGVVISFSGVDESYKFDKEVANLTGTQTLKTIIQTACTQCLGSPTLDHTGNFDLYNTSVDTSKIPEKTTWRQVVSYIAQIAGYIAYIDDTDGLGFKWYDFSVFTDENGLDGGTFNTNTIPYSDGDDADGGDFTFTETEDYDGGTFTDISDYHLIQSYKGLQIGTYEISITGVRVVTEETTVELMSSHTYNYIYVIEVKDNPLCIGIESTVANHLGDKLIDMTFRTFSCSVLCDPTIEAGDMALVVDQKGREFRTFITNVQFGTNSYTQISCQAESIIRQQASYTNEAAKAVVEAKRQTQEQLTAYDVLVQRMNELALNANGLYSAEVRQQDGSVIFYQSDHAMSYAQDGSVIFTAHSHAWKNTGSGTFQCTDTGTTDATSTWTYGVDSEGNAVMNTVAAIGIVADWILAGQLTLGGSATNPANAIIKCYDETDTLIVQIDKNGITMHQGVISSPDYAEQSPAGTYSASGMKIDVLNKLIKSPYFTLNSSGVYLKGHIEANSGSIGAWTIDNQRIYANVGAGAAELNPTKFGIAAINQRNALATFKTNLPYSYAFLDYGGESTEGGNTFGGFYVSAQGNNLYVDPSLAHCRVSATQFTAYGASNRYSIISSTGFQFEQTAVGARFYSNFTNNDSEIVLEGSISSRLICYGPGVNWSYSNAGSGQYSDIRLKEDIHDISVELARNFFKNIRPVEFKYKADTQHRQQYGLIAQELEEALEESNIVNDMIVVEDGSNDHYKQIYANHYEAFSLKAIQDLYEIVQKQQEEIDMLKAEINKLKGV